MMKNKANYLPVSVLLGLLFTIIVYGTKVLNPTHVDWLMHQGDLTQHYIGWLAFRNDSWRFPLGLMNNVVYPFGTSVVFTDSIPLMAIFFKVFNPILPESFQYFGFWCVIVYAGQAYFAAKLMTRLTSSKCAIWLGSLFFMLSPIVMQRMFFHTALSSHFLILAALYLLLERRDADFKRWTCLNCLTLAVHFYLTAIVVVLFCVNCIYTYRTKRDTAYLIKLVALNIGAMTVVAYLVGYFAGSSGISQQGFGVFSLNLNSFINPMEYSAFLRSLPTATIGQHESFVYPGLGGIVLLMLCLFALIQNVKLGTAYDKMLVRPLAVISVLAALYSLSNVITLDDRVLFTIPLPGVIAYICNIFRASARFFWIPYYLATLFAFYVIYASCDSGAKKSMIAAVLIIIQLCDLSAVMRLKRDEFMSDYRYENKLTSDFWDEVGRSMKHVIVGDDENKNYAYIIDRLIPYGLSVNNAYLARDINEDTKNYTRDKIDALKHGRIDDDTIFIFDSYRTTGTNAGFELYLVNEMYVATPIGAFDGVYSECERIGTASKTVPIIVAGNASKQDADFYKAYDGNSSTYWSGNSTQEQDDLIIIELDGYYNINGVSLEYPTGHRDYAVNLSINFSVDKLNWSRCNISHIANSSDYFFDGVYCKYLQLKIDKPLDEEWRVAEVLLYSS